MRKKYGADGYEQAYTVSGQLMVDKGIGCVIIVDGETPMGIFSERDALMRLNTDYAALADQPTSEREAGVGAVTCEVRVDGKRTMIRTEIEMPSTGDQEVVVLEASDPSIWVSEASTHREGGRLVAEAEMIPTQGGPLMLDRSGMRLTVLGNGAAVDIRGCTGR